MTSPSKRLEAVPEGFTRCPCGSPYGEECFKGFCEGCGIEESKRIIRNEERGY